MYETMTPGQPPRQSPLHSPLHTVLGSLRAGLHTMFYFLLIFGVFAAVADDTLTPLAALIAVLICAVYATGARWSKPILWLSVVTFLWLGLMVHGQDFMWLEFPIVFIYLNVLPRWPGLFSAAALWAAAAFIPRWQFPDDWEISMAIGPLIGTVFAVGVYYAYRGLLNEAEHHRQVANALRATRDELARSEHNAGRLEERERLSREIHDTVAQGLSSIVLVARAARRQKDPAKLAQQLETIEEQATNNLGEARRFVTELANSPAEDLLSRIDSAVDSIRSRQAALDDPLQVHVHISGNEPAHLSDEVATTILRTVQEGLTNVTRHARATNVQVSISFMGDGQRTENIAIDIIDDGVGFHGEHGYGLKGLIRRVEACGGTLTLESTPGEGTSLNVIVPVSSSVARTNPEVTDG